MKSRKLKIIGEIILVASFLTQTLLFDFYNDKLSDIEKTATNQSLIDKGAELKEIKYFVATFPRDSDFTHQYKRENIGMAAKKIAISQTIAILSMKGATQEEKNRVNKLMESANDVNDFETYRNFIKEVNSSSIKAEEIKHTVDNIMRNKTIFRFVFLFLYLLGTGILIYSIKFDKS